MKRLFALILCMASIFCLAACSGADAGQASSGTGANGAGSGAGQMEFPSGISEGLEYRIHEDGTGVSIVGIGECTDAYICIPDRVEGLPVTHVEASAFYCKDTLRGIKMGHNIQQIGEFAFFGCAALEVVELNDNLTSIGQYAFSGCLRLSGIDIPQTVESIGAWAFYDCKKLTQVHIQDLEKWFAISFEGVYANPLMLAQTLYLDGEVVTKVVVPESVTVILPWTFAGCKSLTEVQLHENVTEIGQRAFLDCENMTRLVYGGTHAQWKMMVLGTYWDFSVENYMIVCQDKEIKG